jgi:hypothetical protein
MEPSGDEISFPKGELGQNIYYVILCDNCPSYFIVKNLVARLRTRYLTTED